ncbi:MAG: cytochrome b N-terminal domain-containing protein [Alphaproteobacteria bacterium]|nr:cytochrome b N-terminal domain-containing protein [Alphaproteobacteria bacterium]
MNGSASPPQPHPHPLRRAAQNGLMQVEGWFDSAFGPKLNPLTQLGALGYFYFWIVAATGIYLYIVFETSINGVYDSIEYLTVEQWYLGGIMRSLHRYASDALVITMMLHLLREFVLDRYRSVRWFSWFSGIPILWLAFASGINGYWLVWDQLAQYIAVATFEWMDWLPLFGEPIANNFLTRGSLGDRFFSLLVFLHIALPLFLLFAMWIHLLRISRPRVNPPLALAAGTFAMLFLLALYKPALSHPPADLGMVVERVSLDWFYLGFYPLIEIWSAGWVWLLLVGTSTVLSILPWAPPFKRSSPAVVDAANCNGCTRCFEDCPYGAVVMGPRDDGRPFPSIALVSADLCTACGICVGSCPASTPFRTSTQLVTGIDLPQFTLDKLRKDVDQALARLKGESKVVIFGCDHGNDIGKLASPDVAVFSLPCIAMLPPAFMDYVLTRGHADGIMLAGCRENECFHRLGVEWTELRIGGKRDPYLRDRVPRDRIATAWLAPSEPGELAGRLKAFRDNLMAMKISAAKDGEKEHSHVS